jgi:hypothetical protein
MLGQLASTNLPLGDALEPGPLEIVRLDAALGVGRSGKSRWKCAAGQAVPVHPRRLPNLVRRVGDRSRPRYAADERSDIPKKIDRLGVRNSPTQNSKEPS